MNKNYTEELEETLHKLITLFTDPMIYGFLTDTERNRLGDILQNLPQK